MKKIQSPKASIIILNYNGEKVLETTVTSVLACKAPFSYEIILVDNNSSDASPSIIAKLARKYSNVKAVLSNSNDGFSGGNRKGLDVAKGEYIVLLNNDAIVDKNWLWELVITADEHPDVFSVGSKIQLFPKFFFLPLKSLLGSLTIHPYLTQSNLLTYTKRGITVQYSRVDTVDTLHIPLHPVHESRSIHLCIDVSSSQIENPECHFEIPNHSAISHYSYVKNDSGFSLKMILDTSKIPSRELHTKIQNAGIVVYDNGSGRDIGAVVRYYGQDYELDIGQYNTSKEVYASCGASVLYKKDILNKIGFLSEDFFMYYEDVDLAERGRLYGYKTLYQPKSIIRHMHALSSEEWSPFFIYHAEKGRLIHMAHHFPLRIFFQEWYAFTIVAWGRLLSHALHRSEWIKDIQYVKASLSLLLSFPKYMRYRAQHVSSIKSEQLYSSLRDGTWLLS